MEKRLKKPTCRIEALRCRILLLLNQGLRVSEVAHLSGCVRATVYRTLYRFESLGHDALRDQRSPREPAKATAEVEKSLLSGLEHVPKHYGWHRSSWTLEWLGLQLTRHWSALVSEPHSYCVAQLGLSAWSPPTGTAHPRAGTT